jgi:hypothetical protein
MSATDLAKRVLEARAELERTLVATAQALAAAGETLVACSTALTIAAENEQRATSAYIEFLESVTHRPQALN